MIRSPINKKDSKEYAVFFVLAFIFHLAIDSLFPAGTGLTSPITWIRAILMVILLFIFIGFYIPELAKYKNKKETYNRSLFRL